MEHPGTEWGTGAWERKKFRIIFGYQEWGWHPRLQNQNWTRHEPVSHQVSHPHLPSPPPPDSCFLPGFWRRWACSSLAFRASFWMAAWFLSSEAKCAAKPLSIPWFWFRYLQPMKIVCTGVIWCTRRNSVGLPNDLHAPDHQFHELKAARVQLVNANHGLKDTAQALVLVHWPITARYAGCVKPEFMIGGWSQVSQPFCYIESHRRPFQLQIPTLRGGFNHKWYSTWRFPSTCALNIKTYRKHPQICL